MAVLKKTRIFFTGNWQKRGSYLGEPQNILRQLAEFINTSNSRVKIFFKSSWRRENQPDAVYLLFGSFLATIMRYCLLLVQGVRHQRIFFYFFKDKSNWQDVFNSLGVGFSSLFSWPEAFLPRFIYQRLKSFLAEQIIFSSTLESLEKGEKPQDGFLLCSNLEKKQLAKISRITVRRQKFNQQNLQVINFGRDHYLRGVDILADASGRFQKILYLPYRNYLWRRRPDLFVRTSKNLTIVYGYNQKILKEISQADFSVFPFRSREGGPDIPAALIESFILGVPPIISNFLYFPVLRSFNYPLVLKEINPQGLEEIIEQVKSGQIDYLEVMKKCKEISDFFCQNYRYQIEAVAQRLLKKVGAAWN